MVCCSEMSATFFMKTKAAMIIPTTTAESSTTATARSKVRQYFSRQRKEEKIAQGRSILDQTLKHLGLNHVAHADILEYYPRHKDMDDFLQAIGNTDIRPLGWSDAGAFCRQLPHRAGVVAVPCAVFYDDPGPAERALVRWK